jgi:1-acyl-sn-glycerol-3-phosphate acyltransferase
MAAFSRFTQRLSRSALRRLARLVSRALLRLTVTGAAGVPRSGGLLLAMNHLGGADPVLVVAFAPRDLDVIGKAEIMRWPVLGAVARAYGMLPVRRGAPERATLDAALGVLRAERALLIAPEGRESPTQALVSPRSGAGFLALHSRVPILPIAITGTEWARVLGAWRRLRRPCVTLTFGQPFALPPTLRRREAAEVIMRRIAALLPPEYRGVYAASDP